MEAITRKSADSSPGVVLPRSCSRSLQQRPNALTLIRPGGGGGCRYSFVCSEKLEIGMSN